MKIRQTSLVEERCRPHFRNSFSSFSATEWNEFVKDSPYITGQNPYK